MRLRRGVFLFLVVFFGSIGLASASTSILYFSDITQKTDPMAVALRELSQLGSSYTVTTAASSTDFATKIAEGTYKIGIFMVQMFYPKDSSDGITALGSFVSKGGRAIYTDWFMDNSYATLFGAHWTGNYNQTSISIQDSHLANGITNPVSLINPGFNCYSMDVSGSSVAAVFGNNAGAIVIGNDGRSITNGFLTSTFADSSQGVQLYKNEISYLASSHAAPIPGPVWLLGSGLIGLMGLKRKLLG
jgi:hypothetical protein